MSNGEATLMGTAILYGLLDIKGAQLVDSLPEVFHAPCLA
jgi:hypothetical protein